MSNTIQVMLEALKDAEDYLIGSRLCAPLLNTVTGAIAAGKAELRREPVAWIARVPHPWGNDLGQIRQLSYEKSTDDYMPLYTREEIDNSVDAAIAKYTEDL